MFHDLICVDFVRHISRQTYINSQFVHTLFFVLFCFVLICLALAYCRALRS